MNDVIIYEFEDNYFLNVDKLKNEDLKEWIKINSIDYSYNNLLVERDSIIENTDFNIDYDYSLDDIDELRAEKSEQYEDIHKIIKIIEHGEYIELQENTDDYLKFIEKYRDDIIKCNVKGVF